MSSANITNVLLQAAVLAVISVGMTFVVIGGGFDLSVGSVVALSGCVASEVMLHAGILAGFVCGIAAGAAVGVVNGMVVARANVSPFIATLGSMVFVRGLALRDRRREPGAPMRQRLMWPGEPRQHVQVLVGAEPVAQPLRLGDPDLDELRPRRLHQFHLVAVLDDALAHGEIVVIGNADPEFLTVAPRLKAHQTLIDLVRIKDTDQLGERYSGVNW